MQNTAYSPLETLLLFQALRTEGVTHTSFNRISDQLKSIPVVRNDARYDPGRLSPDALKELYLALLKDEAKHDLDDHANGDAHLTNGDAPPASRKRKAPSPSLPTVNEASQNTHLIPLLVTRLYTRYRDHVVTKLQTYEAQYAKAKEHIAEVKAGKWDETLPRNKAASQTQSPRPSPKPSSSAHTQSVLPHQDATQPVPAAAQKAVDGAPKRFAQAKIDAVMNHGPEPQDASNAHRRVSSNTALPPLSEMAPRSPRFGIPPKVPPQIQPMTHASNHAYSQSPPIPHQSPYAPHHAHPRSGSIPSPQIQQSMSRPSSSPRPILPPPKGMQLPAPPSAPHTGSPGLHVHQMPPQQQHPQHMHFQPPPRMPSGEMPPRGYPTTPLPSHPHGYYQQPAYLDRRTSYSSQQAQQMSPYPSQSPHPGGYMLQPFQVQSQDPSKPVQQQAPRPHQPSVPAQRPPPYMSPVYNGPATAPRLAPQPSRLVTDIVAALATPPRPKLRPLWKNSAYRPSTKEDQTPRPRPPIEPLSPTPERAKSSRPTRATQSREAAHQDQSARAETVPKTRSGRRRGNARDKSPHSVVSSTADGSLRARTRSQSVSTAAEFPPPSDDYATSKGTLKAEPSTPANMPEDVEPMAAPSAAPSSAMVTRRRRGTMQSQPTTTAKRKRQDSPGESAGDAETASTPPPRSNTIMATRNFAKMSSAIMNDITSHKHASYFAKEVREKDAPGYHDIVRQPQNLKSIRSAITAGSRAIAAASAALESPGASSSTTVELARSVDLIPPKAIVNGTQLEKELMRMFANAYMFNPGDDGMALSTREMFRDVEMKLGDWRGAEREEEGGKRRKV